MVEIGTIRAGIRFDLGSVDRLFADPGVALADAEGFWGREGPMRCASFSRRVTKVRRG